jgi:branched-chain amino acid transport system substrate-binding protein
MRRPPPALIGHSLQSGRNVMDGTGSQATTRRRLALGTAAITALPFTGIGIGPASAQKAGKARIGIITFPSGGAAGPFGVPARNAAELMIEAVNTGEVPAPYDSKGIGGTAIEPIIVDEAGGTAQQVTGFRNLVERQKVDAVIGYISSGDCLAIAPVAEELKRLTIFFDCGTPRVFEHASYRYVFRTGAHATMDNVATARYLLARKPNVKSIAGINQNYAWGQDSWADFASSMKAPNPGIEVTTEQFPKLYAGQHGGEVSALRATNPEIIHSSFWDGDMEALTLRGSARGLFKGRNVILTTGGTAMHRLGQRMPDGMILGSRGPHGNYARPIPLNDWFRQTYFDHFGTWPTYPSDKMARAIPGLKAATDKAAKGAAGKPFVADEVIADFEHLSFDTPAARWAWRSARDTRRFRKPPTASPSSIGRTVGRPSTRSSIIRRPASIRPTG